MRGNTARRSHLVQFPSSRSVRPGVPVACPLGGEPRVNGGQLLDVAAGMAAQVRPGQ